MINSGDLNQANPSLTSAINMSYQVAYRGYRCELSSVFSLKPPITTISPIPTTLPNQSITLTYSQNFNTNRIPATIRWERWFITYSRGS